MVNQEVSLSYISVCARPTILAVILHVSILYTYRRMYYSQFLYVPPFLQSGLIWAGTLMLRTSRWSAAPLVLPTIPC